MNRTWFMSYILQAAYKRVGLIALANRSITGALEQSIDGVLKEECSGVFKEEAQKLISKFGSIKGATEAILLSEPSKMNLWEKEKTVTEK